MGEKQIVAAVVPWYHGNHGLGEGPETDWHTGEYTGKMHPHGNWLGK